jgi:hypothetical protein
MKTNKMTKPEIRRILWIGIFACFALTALLTACSPSNAVSPLTQTLNGPSGHPEQGLIMDVRSMTGYIDANGNKTEGKLDVIDQKLNKLLDAKGDCVALPTAAAASTPTAVAQVQLPVDYDPTTGNQVISVTQAPTAVAQVQLPVDYDPTTGNQVISVTQVDCAPKGSICVVVPEDTKVIIEVPASATVRGL